MLVVWLLKLSLCGAIMELCIYTSTFFLSVLHSFWKIHYKLFVVADSFVRNTPTY